MISTKIHKLYFPGLISLMLLPILFICYVIKNDRLNKNKGVKISWINNDEYQQFKHSNPTAPDIMTFRKYEEFSMNGNVHHDNSLVLNLEKKIKEIVSKKDTTNAFKVTFSNKANYEGMVSVLDACKQNNVSFMPVDNEVFIYNLPQLSKPEPMIIDNIANNVWIYRTNYNKNLTLFERIENYTSFLYKTTYNFWLSILLILSMLIFTFSKKFRYLKINFF